VTTDVFIAGTGPVGATVARKLLDTTGAKVLMVDPGAQYSSAPGAHLKNSAYYQSNVDPFASVIRGHIHPLSVAVDTAPTPTLGPGAFIVPKDKLGQYKRRNQNPKQDPWLNILCAGATYAVGGMATHCARETHRRARTAVA
jgi:hypothetical protein